jgi:hypothetical protein
MIAKMSLVLVLLMAGCKASLEQRLAVAEQSLTGYNNSITVIAESRLAPPKTLLVLSKMADTAGVTLDNAQDQHRKGNDVDAEFWLGEGKSVLRSLGVSITQAKKGG